MGARCACGRKTGTWPQAGPPGRRYKRWIMDCPKCGHQQADTVKCASCGIYFAKFAQQQALITSFLFVTRREPRASLFACTALALTAIVSTALAWYVLRGHA